jgi:hypothetical protein
MTMNMRLRLTILLVGLLLLGLVYTFPSWQPFLPREQIVEVFPGLPPEYQEPYAALTEEVRSVYDDFRATDPAIAIGIAQAALGTPMPVPTEYRVPPTLQGPMLVAEGAFIEVNAVQWAEGDVEIYEAADGYMLMLFRGFRSARGPDLRVVLWTSRIPLDADGRLQLFDLIDPLEMRGGDIDIGALRGDEGDQYYLLPPEIDLREVHSIVIYSRRYQLVFSIARLRLLR